MRPWITDSVLNPDGDLEVEVTYPDGKVLWLTVPGEAARALDLVALAEVAEPKPPPGLARGSAQPTG